MIENCKAIDGSNAAKPVETGKLTKAPDTTKMVTEELKVKEIIEEVIPKKVTIKQIRKSGLPVEAGHDGEYRYTGTSEFLAPQFKRGTKELLTGLTPQQERDLEKRLNLPGQSEKTPQGTLSRYNSDFWATFKMEMPKGGRTLNVSDDPWDELTWRVLRAHQEVANDEEDRRINGFARYVMTSEEEEAEVINKGARVKRRAYVKFGNMSSSEMKDFLRVWNHTRRSGIKVTEDTKISLVEAAITTVVEDSPQEFLDTLEDDTYKSRIFLRKCMDANLIKQIGNKYGLQGGDVLGYTLDQTVEYLMNKDNQEVILSLKARLEANK